MSTYLINHLRIPGDVPNLSALDYLDQVEATVAPYGGKWLAMGPATVTEGTWPGAVVLMEFPSREQADNWYNSAAYQKILPLRVNSAISDIVLIDELPEGFTVKAYAADVRRQITGG
ncbi:hypothetical protein HDIA_1728 [Hartmannibacter diazotrophicus]|uniref:DUF1330 domain-containing protein n=1 Tax=Hartmannibacter diazotrophicus TaxID=1482074 RepID=A0A2C9D519_9HYPH|nr:DUF1330 domain-containing protein [Hartmannibacter diazotrophicus]SON55269.1 hypothetical protein HDIA_1728 [Hartmannibacter diazotrophicus]